MADVLRVAIVDDHALYRARVAELLHDARDIAVVGYGACADDALCLARHYRPHLILLDLHMPGGGIEAAHRLSLTYPDIAGVILTSSDDDIARAAARAAGARGYLLKGLSGHDLVTIIRYIGIHALCAGDGSSPETTLPLRNTDFWQTH